MKFLTIMMLYKEEPRVFKNFQSYKDLNGNYLIELREDKNRRLRKRLRQCILFFGSKPGILSTVMFTSSVKSPIGN